MAGKRKATSKAIDEVTPAAKVRKNNSSRNLKLTLPVPFTQTGNVLVCGTGDIGQLGLGEDVPEKTRPGLLEAVKDVVDVQAGGMHSLCLTKSGEIYTFGCNDEGALGRDTSEEGSEGLPAIIKLPKPVIRITAGDSHSACLLENGKVFAWGSFRDSHGNMGLTLEGNKREPIQLMPGTVCVSIASGSDHLVLLTETGQVYTVGCAEQGQLGRVSVRSAGGESRRGKNPLLKPEHVPIRFKVDRIWATSFVTFVREYGTDNIHAFGLNNYNQMGLTNTSGTLFSAKKTNFDNVLDIAGGSHHTIIVKSDHKCYAIGRKDYGRLGLGKLDEEVDTLTVIPELENKHTVHIACGESTSFAITDNGEAYAWGFGTSYALGLGNDEDALTPTLITGAQVKGKKVMRVAGGGQHTIFLVQESEAVTNGGKKTTKEAEKAKTKEADKAKTKEADKAKTKEAETNGEA